LRTKTIEYCVRRKLTLLIVQTELSVVPHEILFQLLPDDGTPVTRDEALLSVSARLEREVSASEFDKLVWALGSRVAWDFHSKLLGKAPAAQPLPSVIKCEQDLEPWFERYLYRQAADEFFEPRPPSLNVVVQNTARVGRHEGRFTKPDICMACVSRYHYSPGALVDLFCFELKLAVGFDIPAVMQALSNAAYAHFTYLVVYLPEGSTDPRHISSIRTRAIQHGVGIVRISDHVRDDGYRVILPARRHSPRPGDTEVFIENRFEDANRTALRRWVRS
jgi:hypothetical protein